MPQNDNKIFGQDGDDEESRGMIMMIMRRLHLGFRGQGEAQFLSGIFDDIETDIKHP